MLLRALCIFNHNKHIISNLDEAMFVLLTLVLCVLDFTVTLHACIHGLPVPGMARALLSSH